MPYCEVEDVKARAGVLKDAWDDETPVTDGDLERFIRDAGSTVDIAMAAHGFPAPADDEKVQAALTPVVADMALLTALTATWPGGSGPSSVIDLISSVAARVTAYTDALASGNIGFLLYLREQEEGGEAGSGDFWSSERDYSDWIDDLQTGAIYLAGTGLRLRSPTGPPFHKDMKL